MGTISLSLPTSGTIVAAGLHSSNYGTLQTVINGGLDNNNFATGKIFDPTKLMQSGATNGQTLVWNTGASQWQPGSAAGAAIRKNSITDVVNTVTATDLLGGVGTLPVLGTTSIIRATLVGDYLNNSGAGAAVTLEVKLGATTVWKDTILSSGNSFASANRRAFRVQVELFNQASVSSQQVGGYWWLGAEDTATTGTGGTAGGSAVVGGMAGIAHHEAASPFAGSATEDTSTTKTLAVNVTHGVAAATISCRCLGALIEEVL